MDTSQLAKHTKYKEVVKRDQYIPGRAPAEEASGVFPVMLPQHLYSK
jgi:hypothetical protein